MKCDHITQLHSTTCVENTEKVTFAIYVMTHGLRVSFFIVELTLVITYIPMLKVSLSREDLLKRLSEL